MDEIEYNRLSLDCTARQRTLNKSIRCAVCRDIPNLDALRHSGEFMLNKSVGLFRVVTCVKANLNVRLFFPFFQTFNFCLGYGEGFLKCCNSLFVEVSEEAIFSGGCFT